MDDIVKEFKEKYWKEIRKKANVHGFSGKLRPRIAGGKEVPGTKVIRIYVERKLPIEHLNKRDIVPRALEIDGNRVETDIVVKPRMKYMDGKCHSRTPAAGVLENEHQKRYRPIVAGVSCTHRDSTACTLSWFFEKDGKVYVGLNQHCGGLENKAKIGDEWLQPSPYDGGKCPEDVAAKLSFYVETKFSSFTCPYRNFFKKLFKLFKREEDVNYVDISFGEPLVPVDYRILGVDGPIVGKGKHVIGTHVIKSGRTTGVTEGVIEDDEWNGYVYGARGKAYYEDVVLCRCRCAGGDSGSPVVTPNPDEPGTYLFLGALFAGSDQGDMIYCKHENIEREAGVKIITIRMRGDKSG